ncbi:hypothetical protein NX722_12265 [Endozoicomonas gorgoniicola]|uniref:Uncharacterized protein n=1 Tax=Endozoicomonas gorgoniicola TaxID=1234144 RepID=A0ABT3MWF7_9GAMM|nr:hypothetical protein [Endozoicomonas gorgoniicola]MCW7553393.1 hypothetical protein [Endozoicomonas gorgoniicola]
MTINMRHAVRFLFLTALLLKVVISEGSEYQRSCFIDDESVIVETTTGEGNVPFEHPVKYVVTPDHEWLNGFDLSPEADLSGILPLKIRLGTDISNKALNFALQVAITRLGEIIENSDGRIISNAFSAPVRKRKRHIYTKAALNYIFQDTYHPFDKRINRVLIKPESRVSLYDNKHRFGNIWAMVQPSLDKARGVGFLVAYLDQGVYLLIHEHGFKFLDLAGLRELIKVTLKSWYTWQSATLVPKSMTWNQWLYFLSGYLPSADHVFKCVENNLKVTTFVIASIYLIQKLRAFFSGSDTPPDRRQPDIKKPNAKKTNANKSNTNKSNTNKSNAKKAGYSKSDDKGASCEEYCRNDGSQAQSDQKRSERLRQQEAIQQQEEERLRQQQEEERLRQQRILQLRLDLTNELTQELKREDLDASSLNAVNPEENHRRNRVTEELTNRLDSGWTTEELNAAIFENPDEVLLKRLRWIFKKDGKAPPKKLKQSKKLKQFKDELEKTRW